MSSSINLGLTEELRAFVDSQSGEGTLYATPSEFMRDLIREKKNRLEAAAMRDAIIEGYQDLIDGKFLRFEGDIRELVKEAKRRDKEGWK